MKKIKIVVISFPEIKLQTRDGHKLRGFFADYFKTYSDLLHNHFEDKYLYRYSLVQYKVLDGIATLVAIEDGANLLMELFMKIEFLEIDNTKYYVKNMIIKGGYTQIGETSDFQKYRFKTLWLALNQKNFHRYIAATDELERKAILNSILTGHILGFAQGVGYEVKQRLYVETKVYKRQTRFKNKQMIAFQGQFITNFLLPDLIGLGRSISRGFGTIERIS